jgi:hypothetical protein
MGSWGTKPVSEIPHEYLGSCDNVLLSKIPNSHCGIQVEFHALGLGRQSGRGSKVLHGSNPGHHWARSRRTAPLQLPFSWMMIFGGHRTSTIKLCSVWYTSGPLAYRCDWVLSTLTLLLSAVCISLESPQGCLSCLWLIQSLWSPTSVLQPLPFEVRTTGQSTISGLSWSFSFLTYCELLWQVRYFFYKMIFNAQFIYNTLFL